MYYQETYKGYSPWGGIQHSQIIARGFKAVVTAGHGGYMITQTFADKYLNSETIKNGDAYGNYLCYEEDCAYMMVEFDLLLNHPNLFKDKLVKETSTVEERKEALIESLSSYYPNYLISLGIEPSKKEYEIYLEGIKKDKMRAERHPDLIVSAVGVDKETVKVWTADREIHYVKTDSYRALREDSIILLLSKCELVEYTEQVEAI